MVAKREIRLEKDRLIIDVEIEREGHQSKSGKTIIHYTTAGEQRLGEDINGRPVFVNLNLYSK